MTEPVLPTVVPLPRTETPTPVVVEGEVLPTNGHIITSLCLRDGACVVVCPQSCIIPGRPEADWPRMYVDTEACIDCGACIPECPWEAIWPNEEVPEAYVAQAGQRLNAPGDPQYRARAVERYEGRDMNGRPVVLEQTVTLRAGEVVNLRADILANVAFYTRGPGYKALNP